MASWGSDAILLLISQVAGVLLLGGTLVLIGMRRVYLDAETKQPIEFELPIIGKIKTQAPVFALVVVAAFLVIYPLTRTHTDLVTVEGDVQTSGQPVTLLVVAIPHSQQTYDSSSHVTLKIPLIKDETYRVKYEVDKKIVDDREPVATKNGLSLGVFTWKTEPAALITERTGQPVPNVKAEKVQNSVLENLGIAH